MDEMAEPSGESRSAGSPLPLAGIRVLDLSQVMAGPFCCMLLGDMGADVIKVEPPGVGDQTRRSMGFRMKGEDSPGFLALNRNKRSITINLKNDAGKYGVLQAGQDRRRRWSRTAGPASPQGSASTTRP